MAEYIKKR